MYGSKAWVDYHFDTKLDGKCLLLEMITSAFGCFLLFCFLPFCSVLFCTYIHLTFCFCLFCFHSNSITDWRFFVIYPRPITAPPKNSGKNKETKIIKTGVTTVDRSMYCCGTTVCVTTKLVQQDEYE